MIRKTLVNVGVAALLGGMAVAAQAATLTMASWNFGSGNDVSVSAPTYNGQGGAFKGTISGASENIFNTQFAMYCVELGETINISNGAVHQNYEIVTSTSYFGDAKALKLAKLLTHADPLVNSAGSNTQKAFASTALQLAIWNTVYDTDSTLNFYQNALFSNTSNASLNSLADTYIANSALAVNNLQLFVLRSRDGVPVGNDGLQDQLIYLQGGVPGGGNIPEPTSLALAFGALGALGFATRRRQPAKA